MLVVSEVCAGRYGARRVREGSTRGTERVVGRSAAGTAVGVEEEESLKTCITPHYCPRQP